MLNYTHASLLNIWNYSKIELKNIKNAEHTCLQEKNNKILQVNNFECLVQITFDLLGF